MPKRHQKMPVQHTFSARIPPPTGAAIGAIPFMAPMIASIFANSRPEYLSVATEREMTIPPAPAIPCIRRQPTNCIIVREKIHPIVATANKIMDTIRGRRRPYLSLIGPKNNCPTASPTMLAVSPNCTSEDVVLKYSDMAGRVGRYISMTNGPNAVSMPRNININAFEFFLLFIFIHFCCCKIKEVFNVNHKGLLYKTYHFRNKIKLFADKSVHL